MAKEILNPRVQNVTRVFRTASLADIEESGKWYADALTVAEALAFSNDYTVETVVGVIAAMSPMVSWGANINLATRILGFGGHAPLTGNGLSKNVEKANRIILGEEPLDVLRGEKVRNFYESILTSGKSGVTIDRHAIDIALNKRHTEDTRPAIRGAKYEEFQNVYIRAAEILTEELGTRITPGQVQSVTWMVWRQRYWSKGAFDVK